MHKQYVNYSANMPVSITYETIKNYPIHWHYCIEILYVIKGTINLYINTEKYVINENQIEIINIDEVHSIESDDPDNKVIIFQIDPYFFQKYYADIENMFFYTKSIAEDSQYGEEYEDLRIFLSQILCETVQKQDNYDEEIESILVKLLYHLINNFNYLIYQKEELKDNKDQLQRYHSISKYIYNNYQSNITLKDISSNEYLSTHYLSREIKYATGYSFTDFLNLIRVEESIKLILDTDMTLSEISEEIGFSHTRYFNKHFKIHYKLTPLQFRKKYKATSQELDRATKFEVFPLNDSIESLIYYLEDYDRFNYEDKIHQLNFDMENFIGSFNKDFKKTITIGDAFDLLIEDNKDTLEELQGEMDYEFGRILNLFSTDMAIFPGSKFHNWNRAKDVLEFIEFLDITPIIVLDLNNQSLNNDENINSSVININNPNGSNSLFENINTIYEDFKNILTSFMEYFNAIETLNYKNFKFQFASNFPMDFKEDIIMILENDNLEVLDDVFAINNEINNIYDTAYMVPYIIDNVVNTQGDLSFIRAFDVLDKQVNITNELFFGYPGLINDKGIKKPSFYAYSLLNKLGDTLVTKDDGYVVTKSDNQYQILLYTHHDNISDLISTSSFSKLRGLKNATSKKLSLNITNIHSDINVTTYKINEKIGSSYNYWIDMGRPTRLNKEENGILHKASYPEIKFKYSKKSTVINILTTLKTYGAILILINEVQKPRK
ncbi:MAG: helix-turn-helix domain-containing protein [Clostridium sp.]|uniref:helix-turn-helix domain-containing protein n=1 Tax=Clostridium sp. TaxID=1506 RepID=UPI0030363173